MRFEVVTAKRGVMRRNQYFFRVVADNGAVLAHSESYNNRMDVMNAVEVIRGAAKDAEVRDLT